MAAKIEYRKDEIRVYLSGEIDHHAAGLIRESIDDVLIRKRPKLLVLDFNQVSFMDSSAIGLVMGRFKVVKNIGGKIRVDNLSPTAYKIMKLAGLDTLSELKQKEAVR